MELQPQSSVQLLTFAHVLTVEAAFKMRKKIAETVVPTTQKDSIFSRVRALMGTPDHFVIQILTLVKKIPSRVTQVSPVTIYRRLQVTLDSSATPVQVATQEMVLIAQVKDKLKELCHEFFKILLVGTATKLSETWKWLLKT